MVKVHDGHSSCVLEEHLACHGLALCFLVGVFTYFDAIVSL